MQLFITVFLDPVPQELMINRKSGINISEQCFHFNSPKRLLFLVAANFYLSMKRSTFNGDSNGANRKCLAYV